MAPGPLRLRQARSGSECDVPCGTEGTRGAVTGAPPSSTRRMCRNFRRSDDETEIESGVPESNDGQAAAASAPRHAGRRNGRRRSGRPWPAAGPQGSCAASPRRRSPDGLVERQRTRAAARSKPSGFGHISYSVPDQRKARDWYIDVFSMQAVFDQGSSTAVRFGIPWNDIYITQNQDKKSRGNISHMSCTTSKSSDSKPSRPS